MQFTPLDKKMRAEWREMIKPTDGARLGAAALLFFLSALALPLCRIEAVAGLYLLYAVVFYYMLTHSLAAVVTIALPGVALYGVSSLIPALPHPFLMPAVYTALILGGIGGGFLLAQCRERKYLPLLLLPVVAYAVAGAVVGPYPGLLVLIPAALSLVLGHAMLTCRPQTPVLVTLACVMALSGTVSFLVWYALCGWPVANPFAYISEVLRGGIAELYRTAAQVYAEQGIALSLSDADIRNLAAVIGNILPGLFFAGCSVLSFVIFRTYLRVLTAWGTLSRVPVRLGAMTVSPVAAGLFVLSYVASLIGGVGLFGTICENLALVLEPPMILVGAGALLVKDPKKRSGVSVFMLIALAILLFNYPTLVLTFAAFVGAVRVLLAEILAARRKKDVKK